MASKTTAKTEKNGKGISIVKSPKGSRGWCFTYNNYTEDSYDKLTNMLIEVCKKAIIGRKSVLTTKISVLEGYIEYNGAKTLTAVIRQLNSICPAGHIIRVIEKEGTPYQVWMHYTQDYTDIWTHGPAPKGAITVEISGKTNKNTVFDPSSIKGRKTTVDTPEAEILWDILYDLEKEWYDDKTPDKYWNKRVDITKAWFKGDLYVQKFIENDDDRETGILKKATWSSYTIPAFYVMSCREVIMIWTRKDWRKQGIGRKFIRHFSISKVSNILPESKGFWENVEVIDQSTVAKSYEEAVAKKALLKN